MSTSYKRPAHAHTHLSVHPVEFQVELPAASSFQYVHVGMAVVIGHLNATVSPLEVHSWPNAKGRPVHSENWVNLAVTSAAEHVSDRGDVSVSLNLTRTQGGGAADGRSGRQVSAANG